MTIPGTSTRHREVGRWCIAAAAAVLLAGVTACSDDGSVMSVLALTGNLVPPSEVDTVYNSWQSNELVPPGRHVLRTQEEWTGLWDLIHASWVPPIPAPEVELEGHVLVAAAMGVRPTGGYSIGVSAVGRVGNDLVVEVVERSPARTCGVPDVVSHPIQVVRVPEPAGQIHFRERKLTFACG